MKNFIKYFFLLLALLSLGGASGFGNTLPQVREKHPFSTEDLLAASAMHWAYRENPFQENVDLSRDLFFGSFSVIPGAFSNTERLSASSSDLNFDRDLRREISQQIFPKHFFL